MCRALALSWQCMYALLGATSCIRRLLAVVSVGIWDFYTIDANLCLRSCK